MGGEEVGTDLLEALGITGFGEIPFRTAIQIIYQLAAEFHHGVALALDWIALPCGHPTGPSVVIFGIDADDITLELVAPSARPSS